MVRGTRPRVINGEIDSEQHVRDLRQGEGQPVRELGERRPGIHAPDGRGPSRSLGELSTGGDKLCRLPQEAAEQPPVRPGVPVTVTGRRVVVVFGAV